MPAQSEAQRRLMGAALAAKRGGRAASGKAAKVARGMSESQLRDFARKPSKRKSKRSGRK
ncbi:MAG: DUF3008 family protein [Thermoplasmata archaeon]